ncbi:MAG: phosphoribosylglycinamide formyltransferase [Verrucomicrobiota bacterium]|nr:phosphoribosylglycinamide formyltransferase [Verrucomicrobiota bacterium]
MISEISSLVSLRDELEAAGKRLVFTNGCFDLLHVGHVRYLSEARALGDALVVAINSDQSVRSLKGAGRPLNSADDRAEVLLGLESVDRVVVFDSIRATALIEEVRPHIYAKGGDYTEESLDHEERTALLEAGSTIRILSEVEGKSTTALLASAGEKSTIDPIRIGVLGSGEGTNLESIVGAIQSGGLEAEVVIVISDVCDSVILERARTHGIESVYVDPGDHPARLSMSSQEELADHLIRAEVELVVCAGFMKVLKKPVLEPFAGRVINVHPSLLPRHKGLRAWEQALNSGDAVTGCTVHYVTEEIDSGKIIGQRQVPVEQDDTPELLHARIKGAEHMLLPEVIAELAADLVKSLPLS